MQGSIKLEGIVEKAQGTRYKAHASHLEEFETKSVVGSPALLRERVSSIKNLLASFCVLCLVSCVLCVSACAEEIADLGRIVVTSQRVAAEMGKTASNVSVITQGDIQRSNARNVADILGREPGVHIFNKGSVKTTAVDIGGYGDTAVSNCLVLVNGRRTNPTDISGPDYLQIPLDTIERIEIVRGGASVLYGDNATGGVVNIITKDGARESSSAAMEFGSFQSEKYSVETGVTRGKVSYYLYSGYSDAKGYRDNSQILAKDGQARLGYDVNSQVKVALETGWHEDDYGLSGGLSASEIEQYGRRGTANPEDYGNTKDRFVRLSGEFLPMESDGSWGTVYMDYSHRDRDTYGWYDYGIWGATATKREIITDGITLKYAISPEVRGRDLKLVTGVDYYDSVNRIWGGGSGLSLSTDDLKISKKSLGFYGLAEYEMIDRIFATAGVRQEEARYVFDRYDAAFYTKKNPRETLLSGGLRYEYAERSNVFVKVEETFRFLATDEWYDTWSGLNTDLRQQRGVEYRTGIRHDIKEVMELSVSPFFVANKDEIFLDPTLGGQGKNSNYDRTRRLGIDLGQKVRLLKIVDVSALQFWDVLGGYTYLEAEFDGGKFDGKLIPMTARHQASLGMDVGLKNGLSWNLTGRFTGSQYAINDTDNVTAKVKPYVVVDTKVSYKIKSAEFYMGVNNIFAEKYYSCVVKSASGTNKDYFPAPERSVVMGAKYSF